MAPPPPPPPPVDEAKIAELRAQAQKQEAAKRYNEYVRTLMQLAAAVPDAAEKVDLYLKAADLFVSKFANQAEAVKAYEAILEVDPDNARAIDFLRQMYEKRRDWEKLVGLQRREAGRLPPGPERAARFAEIAKIATERVRKPDVCIELWNEVLASDAENAEALVNLASLYEKSKDFQSLATILEKQAEVTFQSAERVAVLSKLATIYGERLGNDEGAVGAWRGLLAIDPSHRIAQEALKKKYLALGRWDDLEVFYAESGKWDEFIRVLEAQESKESAAAAKIGLLMKIAQLWAARKQKPDRAAKAYEKVLELDPRSIAAAEALVPIYTQAGNAKGLATAIEVKLSHDGDPAERLALLREVAALYEGKLKEPGKAFERYASALALAPGDERCRDDVERAAKTIGRWDDLVAAYRAAIAAAEAEGHASLAVELRLRLGRVLAEEVGRVDDALAEFRAVVEREPDDLRALGALERIYRQTGRHKDLLGVEQRKRDLAQTPEERKQALHAIARLYETDLGDPKQAVATWTTALEDDAMDGVALEALDGLYRGLGDHQAHADVLRRRIELDVGEDLLIDLKYRLAQTLDLHLGDARGGIENYREILFLEQGHDGAREALEQMIGRAELRAEAAAILEGVYEVRADWKRLVEVLGILADAEADPVKRVELRRKTARTAEDALGDLPLAFSAQAKALEDDPSLADSRAALERLAKAADLWVDLDQVFERIAGSIADARLAREYWMRLAAIDRQLGKVDEAARGYAQVLERDPTDAEALDAIEDLYRSSQRWNDVVQVLRRRIDLGPTGPQREALYAQVAQVHEEKLGRPEDAIAAWREVLALDDTSLAALAALDALFRRQKMWAELCDNLEAQLRLADTEEAQLVLMLRLAGLREREMGQAPLAIEGYRQVLDRDPQNADALAALERLGRDPAHELVVAEILEPLYRASGDYPKLVGVYEVQVRRAEDAARRVELHHTIATLHEDAAGDLGAAFDSLARALREDPAHPETQQSLARLARASDRFADYARVLVDLAGTQSDPALAGALHATAARIYQDDLRDTDRAIAHFGKVLEIEPSNLDATEALEQLFRGADRWADLSVVLQRKAQVLDDPAAKKEALVQAARIEEEVLERADAAVAVWRAILEFDSEDLAAIDALVRLFLALSRWDDLLGVYTRKADLVEDVDEKKQIFYQMGAVYERELGNVARAIDTYAHVLELDPDDLVALGRLDALYQAAQNWAELLSVLQHEAELAADPNESVSYRYRIGELYDRHLGDVARAIEIYREILGTQPDHEPALAALEALKSGDRDPVGAASVLETVYEAAGDWARLTSVLEVEVAHEADAPRKVEILHRIARLEEEALENPQAAFSTWARAVALDSQNEVTLGSLERLADAVGRWRDVAALYDAELGKLAQEPRRLAELGLRAAQIYEEQIADVESAIVRYRRVVDAEPDNAVALRSLDRLLAQTGKWADLAQVLVREAEIGETPDDILELRYRLGQVREQRLSDVDGAIAAYREVLGAAPEHGPAREALERLFAAGTKQVEIAEILEPLYHAAGEWDRLVQVREAELAHVTDPAERLATYTRIAELHEEKLVDPAAALAVHVRALKEAPSEEAVVAEVERLGAVVDGGWDTVANAYADVLGLHADPAVQKALGKRLARVFEEELGDATNAEETYRYVLGVDALDPDALANLDRIYASLEQWPELAGVLEQRVRATSDRLELVDLHARLGQIYEERLTQVDDAVRVFRRIFDELDRAHEGAIEALARLYEQKHAWRELGQVYDRELENASGDVREAEIRAKVARLAQERLGDPARAMETWKRVLDLRGEDAEALGALADLYEAGQKWGELCDVLERQYDIADSDDTRVAILVRRAGILVGKLGRDEQALTDYGRALDVDYGNLDALRAVADIWRRRKDPAELVQALHAVVDRAAASLEGAELSAVYHELGATYADVLDRPYEAADAWRKLLELDPGDFKAMAALEKIYRAQQSWTDVVDVKMQRAEALADPQEKIRELLEVAEIWDSYVGDRDRGTLAYEKILALDPRHDRAYQFLEQLHVEAERWEPLIELYLGRLETRESAGDKAELLRKIARVFEEKLDDKGQAFDALVNALSEDFGDAETVRYLERMAQATGRWAELVQTANEWLKAEKEPARQVQLSLRLAKWYGEDLGHPEYAQPYYQKIIQLDPHNVAVLRQMASLYRKNAQWQQAGATLTRALDVAVIDVDRKEILFELGDLLEKHMGEVDQALGFYTRSLEVDPLHLPALEALERVYDGRGMHRELADVIGRKVKALTDAEAAAEHKLRMAGLFEVQLANLERAAEIYRDVLAADRGSLPALRGLERVWEQTQNWQELVRVLEQELDVLLTERERIEALLRLGSLLEEQFVKPELAAQRYEQVVDIDPAQEDALGALERCYRRLRQWHDLIGTYERHIAVTLDRQTKVDLYGQIAVIYTDELEDVDRAIDAHRNIVDIDESNLGALEALAKLYDKQGDAPQAIEYMTRVADLTADGRQRVEMYFRIGKALEEKVGDRVQAQDRYEMALDLDPAHLQSLAALRQIAVDAADWDRAARFLEQEQLHTTMPRQRAKLLVELGRMREEMLGEHDQAVQAWELALQCDPDAEDAAQPLLGEYVRTERWADAEPLAELLVKKAGKRDRAEQHELWKTLGRITAAVGKDDRALKAFHEAHKLDLTDQETIRGLADVSFRLRDWAGALTNYQKVLTSLGEDQVAERADVYFRLGAIKKEQGQTKPAIGNFEKALGLDPAHRASLEALVAIYTDLKDWKQVCAYKRQILDNVFETEERFAMLVDIGDTWSDKQKNPQRAIETYEEALEIQPQNHVLLHKLLALYQQIENWPKVIEIIQSIAGLETNPERKARYLFTMAQVYRDKEQDLDRAVELFNEALDLHPGFLEAFERINRILTQQKNWKQLERAFRKMLHRATGKGNADLEFNLWHNLGLIYRDRLQEMQPSIEAFKMAARIKPEESLERQILAELYETTEQYDLAVTEQQEILHKDPMRVDPYRALYRLYLRQHQYDQAWCMCAALAFLRRADEEEQRFFEDYRPQGMLQVKSRLDNELWIRHLFHPDENLYIGKIFEMVAPAALAAKVTQLKTSRQAPVLDRRFRQDPATSTVTFARTFGWAAQVLGIQPPELYVRNDVPGALAAVPALPPASVAGSTVLTGFQPQELTFIVGKHLAYYRGEHYIKNLFPTVAELTMVLFAGIRLVQPEAPVPPEMAQQIAVTAAELAKYVQPVHLEGLRLVVKKFMEEGGKANIKRWSQAVELSACRAGLLVCGDLDTAKKLLTAEPQVPGDLPVQDKVKELIAFSVSQPYFALRQTLGIAIG